MRKGIGIILFLILFFQASTGIFGATNILDDFNDTITNEWGEYGYTYGAGILSTTIHSEADISPRVGATGYAMNIKAYGRVGNTYNDGFGMGVFFTNKAKWSWDEDWSSYTNLRFYVWNNTTDNYAKMEIQIFDTDNTKVQWSSQPNLNADQWKWTGNKWYILKLEVGTGSEAQNNHYFKFTMKGGGNGIMDWAHIKQIQFQISPGGVSGLYKWKWVNFNVDEIQLIGEGPPAGPGISLDVKIQPRTGVWSSTGLSQITFPENIDTDGSVWTLSDSVITVQYSSVSNNPKLLFYTDNEDTSAEYQYTGSDDCGGLIGEDHTTVAPVIWSLYDNRISETTNFSGIWNAYYSLNSPLLPLNWAPSEWINIYGPYIDGYWSYIVDVGNPGYDWNTVGQYCAVIAETNETGAFRKPSQSPLKGWLQETPAVTNCGTWIGYKGPFGGFYINDNFKSDMAQGTDDLADIVIYLGAGFKGKPIQNYKSNRFIIELIHY